MTRVDRERIFARIEVKEARALDQISRFPGLKIV